MGGPNKDPSRPASTAEQHQQSMRQMENYQANSIYTTTTTIMWEQLPCRQLMQLVQFLWGRSFNYYGEYVSTTLTGFAVTMTSHAYPTISPRHCCYTVIAIVFLEHYTKEFDEHSCPLLTPWKKTEEYLCNGSQPYLPSRSGPLKTQQPHRMLASRNWYCYNVNWMQSDVKLGCNSPLLSSLWPADVCIKCFPMVSYSPLVYLLVCVHMWPVHKAYQ